MEGTPREERLTRSATAQSPPSTALVRLAVERELREAKEALERKSLELAAQHEWFRITLSSIGDAVITTDLQSRVTFLNPVAEALTGWSSAEACGHPLGEVFRVIDEETRDPAANPLERVLGEGVVTGLAGHTMLISRSARETPIEDSAAPIRDAEGQIAGAVLVFHDVTERRVAERSLQQSEARLNLAMNAGQMGVWEWIIADQRVTWSPTLETIHGLTTGTFGGTFEDFQRDMHPADRSRVLAKIQESVEHRSDYRVEYRIIKPDGTLSWIESRGKLYLDEQGRPERMAGVCMDVTLRKQVEEALRQSEQFNRTIVESSRDCIKTLDLSGKLLWMSETARHVLCAGDHQEVIGKSWVDLWDEQERPPAWAAVQTAAQGGTGHFVGRYAVLGQRRYWDVVITPICDPDGHPERLLAISRDITERRKLDETHARLAAVVEFSDDAIISKTLEGVITTWNTGAEKVFGYQAHEVVGKPVTILIPPERLHEEPTILDRVRRGLTVLPYETVRVRKDGKRINVSLTVSPVKDSTGTIVGVSKIARDTTQRKEAEEERARLLALEQAARAQAEAAEVRSRFLAEASARLASTLDYEDTLRNIARAAVPEIADWCAVHMADRGGEVRMVAIAHIDPEKIAIAAELGERYPDSPDSAIGIPAVLRTREPQLISEITDELLAGAARDDEHLVLLRRLGLRSAVIVPLVANGEAFGAISLGAAESGRHFAAADLPFAEDLAARAATAALNARLYRELREANAAKDHFLAVLSHELRTPLNPVLMTVTDLERDEAIPPAVRQQLTVVRRNVELEARLIDDLLDSTRIAKGKLQLHRSVVDACELLQRATGIVEREARDKGVKIEMINCQAACPVDADPARLQQVIWNVVKNAVKFTPEGGRVRISSEITPAQHLRITVEDNGIGIEPEFLGKIFNAFEQGDTGTGHRFGGLGLGLAISKALVTLHGGTLTAVSEGRGRGATFVIELPLAAGSATPVAPGSIPSQPRRALRLLVVEDDEATSSVMRRLLTKRGYSVVSASSIQEALTLLPVNPVDILISDVGLPDGSGRELMEKLRQTQELPGIALSGYGTENDVEQSRLVGFSVHLTKPVDIDRLDQEIQTLGKASYPPGTGNR